jgi:hypothetical protein
MSLSEVSGSGETDRSLTLTAARQITLRLHNFSLFLYSAMSTVTAISFKLKATRKRLKKEILSDDFKKRKIFRMGKFSTENFPPHITTHNPEDQNPYFYLHHKPTSFPFLIILTRGWQTLLQRLITQFTAYLSASLMYFLFGDSQCYRTERGDWSVNRTTLILTITPDTWLRILRTPINLLVQFVALPLETNQKPIESPDRLSFPIYQTLLSHEKLHQVKPQRRRTN